MLNTKAIIGTGSLDARIDTSNRIFLNIAYVTYSNVATGYLLLGSYPIAIYTDNAGHNALGVFRLSSLPTASSFTFEKSIITGQVKLAAVSDGSDNCVIQTTQKTLATDQKSDIYWSNAILTLDSNERLLCKRVLSYTEMASTRFGHVQTLIVKNNSMWHLVIDDSVV